MEDFTLGLALDDYLTVIFFATGLFFLWRLSAGPDPLAGRLVAAGGGLIVLGGAAKASWKLILALSGPDIHWLDNSHFILMSPGYILLATGIVMAVQRRSGETVSRNRVALGILMVVLTLVAAWVVSLTMEGRSWFFVLLGMATIMNVVVSGVLVRFNWRQGKRSAAYLFAFNLVMVFLLAGMARVLGRSLLGQWIEQISSNISFAAFALACWLTDQHLSAPFRSPAPPSIPED